MGSMQSGTDVGAGASVGTTVEVTLDTEDDTVPGATSLVTPRTELFTRTRVSRTQRPDHQSLDVAWDTITSYLIFFLRHLVVPQPIRLQAARALDDIQGLVIIPHHLTAATGDLQAAVQRHILDVLVQQIMLSDTTSSTNTA